MLLIRGKPPESLIAAGKLPQQGDVIFVVEAGYHLPDALATSARLEEQGHRTSLVCYPPRADVLSRFRSSTARHREIVRGAASEGLVLTAGVDMRTVETASALVVRNDWGPSRSLVVEAQQCLVPTIGWVEGVQDFDDVDTGRDRNAYGTVDHVLTLGEYDRERLASRSNAVAVGSQHLFETWNGPATTADIPVVINVNFTYGVLTRHRPRWVRDAVGACRAAGIRPTISRHPADRGLVGRHWQARTPMSALLPQASRLITRFSTVLYEALALGVDSIYYNPHGELVDTFTDTRGAFAFARTRAELEAWLSTAARPPELVRREASDFLHHHLALTVPKPAERAADAIRRVLDAKPQ